MIKIIVRNTVLNSKETYSLVLSYNNWNDYGYNTSYDVCYFDSTQNRHTIGKVKIYHQLMDMHDQSDGIVNRHIDNYLQEAEINELSEECCSLGQSPSFYSNLEKYCADETRSILERLRDLATNDAIYERFLACEGVKKSLLREVEAKRALTEARKILEADQEDGIEDYATVDVQTETDREEIYPYTSIKIERNQFSIYEMKRKYDKQRLCLEPDFQRHFVWNLKQQSELIESVVMGIPLPLIYLAENQNGELVVVDGQQRLTTFIRFLNNEFRLFGLSILQELNGKNCEDLSKDFPSYVSTIEDYQMVIQVIKYPTPDRIRFDIFDRVNRGGTPLNKQEMRNALYQGESTLLLKRLTESEEFRRATGGSVSEKHMKDSYIVLRALAFTLVLQNRLKDKKGNPVAYKSDMDELMAKTMEYLNRCSDDERMQMEEDFKTIMDRINKVFGEDAFRIENKAGRRRPISMTLFETIYYMLFLAKNRNLTDEQIKNLYRKLLDDTEYMDAVQYSVDSSRNVRMRFEKVQNYVEEF